MATPDVLANDRIYTGTVTFGRAPSFPAGTVADASVASNAAIQYSKIVGQHIVTRQLYPEGGTILALASELLSVVRGTSGTLIGFDAILGTVMSSSNTVTVDLQKITSSTTGVTVCSSPITLTSTSAANTRYSATFSSSGMLVGDIFRAVVTTSGTTSGQAKGLLISKHWSEAPA